MKHKFRVRLTEKDHLLMHIEDEDLNLSFNDETYEAMRSLTVIQIFAMQKLFCEIRERAIKENKEE